MVDAILEAGAQVLEAAGVDGFNTNAVAERAGVSIGTLYRYMANKEAILTELARREQEAVRDAIGRAFAGKADAAPDRAAIRAFLGAFAGLAAVRRTVLVEMLARSGHGVDEAEWIEPLLRDQAGSPLPELRAFVLSRALLGTIRAAVLFRPALCHEQAFEDELVRLARSYVNI